MKVELVCSIKMELVFSIKMELVCSMKMELVWFEFEESEKREESYSHKSLIYRSSIVI